MSARRACGCDDAAAEALSLSRRGFLGVGVGGLVGLALSGPRALFAQEAARAALPGFGVAEHCIVLWLNGGPSQLETFDPKPGTAQGGPTKAIKTAATGVELADTLPRLAEHMDKVALIRSMATREGNHQRARYYLHTGYVPSGTVKHPDLGALVCQQRADTSSDLPPYVCIAGATPGAGILGVTYAPFNVNDPRRPLENMSYAEGVDAERFRRRRELLDALDASFAEERAGPEVDGHRATYQKADRLMHSPRLKAFTLDDEPQALRAAYGEDRFGQGCLMARRLVEQGVRVVEVQLNGWDTHQDNFGRTRALGTQLDAGFATLLADLAERDLLEKTLIVCMGEFGRTPRINPNEGRDHWARCWSLALAGGPVRGGTVVGATTPDGMEVAERPVRAQDLMATIAHAMGLDAEKVNYTSGGRPISVVDGGEPVKELFG